MFGILGEEILRERNFPIIFRLLAKGLQDLSLGGGRVENKILLLLRENWQRSRQSQQDQAGEITFHEELLSEEIYHK